MGTVRARDPASLAGAARSGKAVARPGLVRLLEQSLDTPLTLIVAPMGYGKTAAVHELLSTRALPRPAAIVALPRPDDAASFCEHVVGHMAAAWPDLGLPDGRTGGRTTLDVRRVLPALHERTAAVDGPLIVVLDELHRVRDRAALAELAYLVDRLPPAIRLVASGRRLPALPVGRWRAQGRVAEVTVDDLRFRPDEVAALLGPDAGAAAVRSLTERSEGWVAGLQLLAALPDPRAPLDPGAAGELLDKVLADQPADVQDFLLATSLLGRFSADLCRVVTGRADAGTVLHDLEAANLFVVALDDQGDWFRYQHLFAELLRSRLAERTTSAHHVERRRAMHRRAAAWFESDGKPADAVAHHVRAGEVDRAFALLNDDVDVFARDPQVQAIDWEGMFPTEWLVQDPQRMIWFAALLAPTGGIERMGVWLDRAEAALDTGPGTAGGPGASGGSGPGAAGPAAPGADPRGLRGLHAAVRTYWYALQCDAPRTIEWGQRALALLGDGVTARIMGRRVQISMLAAQLLIDDLDGADRVCARLDEPDVPEIVRSLVVPGYRARLALRRGRLTQAEGLARLVRRAAGAMGVPLHLGVRDANVALGGVLAERGESEDAAELLDEAIAMAQGRRWRPPALITLVERVRLDAAVAGPDVALARVDEMRRTIAAHPVGPDAVAAVDVLEATLRLATGSLERASDLVVGLRPGIRRRLLEVRLALAADDYEQAGPLLAGAAPGNLRDRLVVDLLTARLAAATGDHPARDRHLRVAADRAQAQGFRRTFLDEAPELVPALRAIAEGHTDLRPLVDEVEALAAGTGHGRAEPLTEREVAVLRYLQSQLTHHEIAGELGISANTLKTHTRALYRKLGATSRTEALDAAARAGLL